MELRKVEWQEQGYHLLLVEAELDYFHLFVSADGGSYAIYDRFRAPCLETARASIRFIPFLYEAISPSFPISKSRALSGETGIPSYMENMDMQRVLLYSNLFADLLINKLEECSSDGIDCDHCLVAARCTACWDTICQQLLLDEYRYSEFAARLAKIRNRKWNPADGKPSAVKDRDEPDAGKAV